MQNLIHSPTPTDEEPVTAHRAGRRQCRGGPALALVPEAEPQRQSAGPRGSTTQARPPADAADRPFAMDQGMARWRLRLVEPSSTLI